MMAPRERFLFFVQYYLNLLCGGSGGVIVIDQGRSKVEVSSQTGIVWKIERILFGAAGLQTVDPELVRLAVVQGLVEVGSTVWSDSNYRDFLVGSQGRPIGVQQKIIDGTDFVGEVLGMEQPCGIDWVDGQPIDCRVGGGARALRRLAREEILNAATA